PTGQATALATEAAGRPVGLADDLDVAPDGRVYFSDASSKFTVAACADPTRATDHAHHAR
ncbi:MAG: hypothetical protein ACKOFO_01535, partial [Gemmatimonadota bacterium]